MELSVVLKTELPNLARGGADQTELQLYGNSCHLVKTTDPNPCPNWQ
jgi:hypothetical protein